MGSYLSIAIPALASERSQSHQKEMQSRKRNQIRRQFPQIAVQLSRKSQGTRYRGHYLGYQVVEVAVGGGAEFESTRTDVEEGLVVEAVDGICVFDELM